MEVVVSEDALAKARNVLNEHGLALSVRSNDKVVEGEREFDDGVKARE